MACCDVDPDARGATPEGVPFTADLDELLATPGLEAVHVCVPQHLHADVVVAALDRGVAVFCEKPMAHALADADRMIAAAERTGGTLVIGHTLRFDPGYVAVAEAVAAGTIGEPVSLSARWCAPDYEGRIISGRTTVPQEMMIHDLDVMQWLAGPIVRVHAEAYLPQVVGPGPDSAVATVRFAGGAIGSLDHNWIAPSGSGMRSDHQLAVYGTDGALFVNNQDSPLRIYGEGTLRRPDPGYYTYPLGIPYGSVPTEDRHFVRHVRHGEPWPITLAEARSALACAMAVERSHGRGRARRRVPRGRTPQRHDHRSRDPRAAGRHLHRHAPDPALQARPAQHVPLRPAAAQPGRRALRGRGLHAALHPGARGPRRRAAFDDPEHPQRKAIETVPAGHVLVMDSRGEPRAASCGQILATRLRVRGVAAVVTDGSVRDSAAIAELDLPVYTAGVSASVNLVAHHAVDFNVPIACAGWRSTRATCSWATPRASWSCPRHLADEVAARRRRAGGASRRSCWQRVRDGAPLPGTYPPSAETRARYAEQRADPGRP